MRKISADYLFTSVGKPLKRGILVIDNQGTIADVIDTEGELYESCNLEFYNGILVPGFVNAHCHLELSHLKGQLTEHAGLHHFISELPSHRHQSNEVMLAAALKAESEMKDEGIIAVADISNTSLTAELKQQSSLFYHTFVEVFGLSEDRATSIMLQATDVCTQFGEHASITPHAPYSVSKKLWNLLQQHTAKNSTMLSFHNQESPYENELFISNTGPLAEQIRNYPGGETSLVSKQTSLRTVFEYLKSASHLLLIHNTFSSRADIEWAQQQHPNLFWVLCPLSNRYIENQLPQLEFFTHSNLNICIGTDSLASNHRLSILSEIKLLQESAPDVPLTDWLRYATLNGARALGIDTNYGSFEPGKRPGINLITQVDLQKLKLTDKSRVRVIG